jgi:hypothetical protein
LRGSAIHAASYCVTVVKSLKDLDGTLLHHLLMPHRKTITWAAASETRIFISKNLKYTIATNIKE